MTDQIRINTVDDEPDQLLGFVLNPNQAPSRERLRDLVHNCGCEFVDPTLTSVSEPAAKLSRDPEKPQLIRTMRSAGSMFVPSKP